MARLGLLAGGQVGVGGAHGGDRLHAGEGVGEGLDALGPQALQLLAPGGDQVVQGPRGELVGRLSALGHGRRLRGPAVGPRPAHLSPMSILVIFSLRAGPRGTDTETTSLRLRPISARPTGDSLDSLFSVGLASAEPTIVYLVDLPVFSSLTWTIEPTCTTSVVTSLASMTVARRSFSSSWAMRCSSIACSFLASSYSEFSAMSPNSRASLMRSATSRRLSVESSSSSSLSFFSPSGVRMTSLGM